MKRTIYYCDFCGQEIKDLNQAVKYEVNAGRLADKRVCRIDAHDLCVEAFLARVRHEKLKDWTSEHLGERKDYECTKNN